MLYTTNRIFWNLYKNCFAKPIKSKVLSTLYMWRFNLQQEVCPLTPLKWISQSVNQERFSKFEVLFQIQQFQSVERGFVLNLVSWTSSRTKFRCGQLYDLLKKFVLSVSSITVYYVSKTS